MRCRRASAIVILALVAACGDGAGPPQARLSLVETLGGDDTRGFARALEPREFTFPLDHGPHPDFRNEWWYVTGNLDAEGGRKLGFQFTVFRSSLSPVAPEGTSAWRTNQAFMAHFAVTDEAGRRFYAFERFARGSVGLAGAQSDPFRVWLETWSLASADSAQDGTFPLRLQAAEGDVALDLVLDEGKPRVLQGNGGLSQKGPEPGNASYYFAHTRMPSTGTVVLGADTLRVSGLAWLDREWSTSALSQGQVGWDWFALQLDHGWELMVYALRRVDGSAHPLSDGVLIAPDGSRRPLTWGKDISVTPTRRWTSPLDGAAYPSGWRIEIPEGDWALDVTPVLPDQELKLAFRYWEGAVRVSGRSEGREVTGRGYVELTGYAGERPER